MGGQFEYDVGPQAAEDDAASAEDRDGQFKHLDTPWVVGLIGGVGTFLTLYAIMYQLASAVLATGAMGASEITPPRRVLAGLTMLSSHGGALDLSDETIGFQLFNVVTTHLSALVTVTVLLVAGYLLSRHLATDDLVTSGKTAAQAGGVFLASYVVLSILLAVVTRWTLGDEEGDTTGLNEPETITVSADLSLVLTVGGTVAVFLALGGLLGLYATFGMARGRDAKRTRDIARLGTDDADAHHDASEDDAHDDESRADEGAPRSGDEPAQSRDEPVQSRDEERAPDRTAVRGGVADSPRRSVDPERERERSPDEDEEPDEPREDIDPRDRYGTDLQK